MRYRYVATHRGEGVQIQIAGGVVEDFPLAFGRRGIIQGRGRFRFVPYRTGFGRRSSLVELSIKSTVSIWAYKLQRLQGVDRRLAELDV